MRIANNTQTAHPLSNGDIIPAGTQMTVDDEVGRDAVERGAVDQVEQSPSSKAHSKEAS